MMIFIWVLSKKFLSSSALQRLTFVFLLVFILVPGLWSIWNCFCVSVWCEVRVIVKFLLIWISSSLKRLIFPLNCLDIFAKSQLSIYERVCIFYSLFFVFSSFIVTSLLWLASCLSCLRFTQLQSIGFYLSRCLKNFSHHLSK